MNQRLTWHQAQWQSVETRLTQQRLPHALLLTGPKGVGKVAFAEQLGAGLLCDKAPAATQCGQCQNCRLRDTGNHPDIKVVTFEVNPKDGKVAKEIKVDQIREISESLALKSQFGGYKVAIVYPADKLNQNAANSILKTLEEPTEKTILILVTDYPSRLLPTIRSRCQEIKFSMPSEQQAVAWLQAKLPGVQADALLAMANGAPMLAYQAAEGDWLNLRTALYQQLTLVGMKQQTGITMAAAMMKQGAAEAMEQIMMWCNSWVSDVIRLKTVPAESANVQNQDYAQQLSQLAQQGNTRDLYQWYDTIISAQASVGSSLNPQQVFEKLFSEWGEVFG